MTDLKTIGDYEKEKGCIIIGANPLKKITEEEFNALPQHGVAHDDRIAFLEANGYKVTRENMVADLSAKDPTASED